MSKKYNVALIGCGRISTKHIEAIVSNKQEMELLAVSDLVAKKMDKAILKYYQELRKKNKDFQKKKIKKYPNYLSLLENNEIDIVIIGTESGYHAHIAINALKSNKHVIVEKPMALSVKDAEKMIEAAKSKNLKLAVCHQNRFNPTIQKLRKALMQGRFGKIIHGVACVRWNRDDQYYNMDDWHGTLLLDGGILMNQCIHNIDILRWMLGDVERVYAESDTFLRDIETEDTALAVLKFTNGALGLIEGTVCVFPENLEETFSLFGEKGTVTIAGSALNKIKNWKFADGVDEKDEIKKISYESQSVYGYGHNLLFKDFIKSIKEDRKPLVDGEEGKKAIELILGIYKAAQTAIVIYF
ncbi:MAG: Gfo/Idh/MocA family protein [Halanaerobiales bacterium]